MDTGRASLRSGVEVRKAAVVSARPSVRRGLRRLLTFFTAAASVLAYLACPSVPPPGTALALSARAPLVRIFIVPHDRGHGSLFGFARPAVA